MQRVVEHFNGFAHKFFFVKTDDVVTLLIDTRPQLLKSAAVELGFVERQFYSVLAGILWFDRVRIIDRVQHLDNIGSTVCGFLR